MAWLPAVVAYAEGDPRRALNLLEPGSNACYATISASSFLTSTAFRSDVARTRLGHASAVPLVEFTRFRVRPENVLTALAARVAMIDVLRSDGAGFVGAILIRIDARDWLDVSVSESEAACEAALVGASGATATFLDMVNGPREACAPPHWALAGSSQGQSGGPAPAPIARRAEALGIAEYLQVGHPGLPLDRYQCAPMWQRRFGGQRDRQPARTMSRHTE